MASLFCRLKTVKRHLIIFAILILIFAFDSNALAQSPVSGFNPAELVDALDCIFIDERAFAGNNALPLRALFFDKWEGPFSPGARNNLDAYWKADTGLISHGWRIAGFYRGELFAETNKDTIEILRMINLEQELPVGREFKIDLKGEGFSAYGIETSKAINLDRFVTGLAVGFTARYMTGEKIQEGTIKGDATATGPESYDFDLSLDYIYDENLIYKRRDAVPGTGDGYSFDIGARYDFSKKLRGEVLVRDLLGRIYWRDVPYTTADATSDVTSFDEDGYQVYRPTISGYESYKDFTQKIPLKTDLVLIYKDGPYTVRPTVNFIEDRPLYWIDLGYRVTEKSSVNAGYNTNYRAFSIGASYKNALLSFYSSDIDLNRTNAIGLTLSLRYEL